MLIFLRMLTQSQTRGPIKTCSAQTYDNVKAKIQETKFGNVTSVEAAIHGTEVRMPKPRQDNSNGNKSESK